MPPTSPAALITQAAARRARIPEISDGTGSTTACRLFDGEGDGLPSVEIDTYGGHWVVQTRDTAFPDFLRHEPLPPGCRSVWWKRLDQRDKQSPQPIAGDAPSAPFAVRELGLNYEIDLTAGYSQGLFLDQRDQRARLMSQLAPGQRMLNLFAYTCAFSVAAAARGAVTTSVDLSRPYLEWGKRNMALNGLDSESHFFCRGDVPEWLRRFAKKGRTWDWIVVDPPTFSRNADGKLFRVENDFPALTAACLEVLAPGGWLLASTNHRGLTPSRFEALVRDGAALAGRRVLAAEPGRMPADFTGEPYLKALWLSV
jgi:23S rRNA (cytosine1962-C5)-methyltransferase